MSNAMMIEMIGYVGSILVLVSFLMTSVVKLRVIDSIGGFIFAVYAMIIHSYPTALMNICLVLINIYYLVRMKKSSTQYDLIEGKPDNSFFQYFLDHYKEDMKNCFPGLDFQAVWGNRAYLICCDTVPAGILLGNVQKDGTLDILLDYSTPTYRDCSVGTFLYSKLPEKGVRRLTYSHNPEKHEEYMVKMGFVKENGIYVKNLK